MQIQSALLVRVSSVVDKVDHPQFFDPSYQLKYIQAELERLPGTKVVIHDCWIHPTPTAELLAIAEELQPDLVVVSSSSFDVDVSNAFAEGLGKLAKKPIVLGIGQGQYLNRDWSQGHAEYYDVILLGEPEEEFQVLLKRMLDEGTDSKAWRMHYKQLFDDGKRFQVLDLDALPFPSYTQEELEAYRSIYPVRLAKRVIWGFLIAGRGCPYACTFCSEVMRVSIGTKMRVRSGRNVADEMEHLVREGANIISFQDDSFSSSKRQVEDVCQELIRRGSRIPWMARVRSDEVDYELLRMMRDAGCIFLGIGVEAGAQRIVDRVRKTYKPKPWADLCRVTFKACHELGIGTNAYYVLGNPTETREEMEQTIELALELNADSIQVHFHTPYPGSADWNEYKEVYEDLDPTKMFHYAKPVYSLAEVSPDELLEIRSRFYKRYLFRPGFALRHMWKHKGFYLKNPDIFLTLLGIRKIFSTKGHDEPEGEAPKKRARPGATEAQAPAAADEAPELVGVGGGRTKVERKATS
ncbi:MAG: radical SAM protein [Planctomycetota bacterium]